MKLKDKIRVRQAFMEALKDTSVENGINNDRVMRSLFKAALFMPAFYEEVEKTLEEESMSVDEYIEQIPQEWKKGFDFNIPS